MSDKNLPESNFHDGEKTCFSCNKSFAQKRNLMSHISVVHDKKTDFICEICEHSFGNNYELNIHIESVHEGKKPHKCTICAAHFSQKSNQTMAAEQDRGANHVGKR